MKIGLYCNWGITKYQGEFYISSIHKNYIDLFQKNSSELFLLSKTKKDTPSSDDIKIEGIQIIELPYFSSYLTSVKYFFHIIYGISKLVKETDFVYIRVPEPFSWFATLVKYFYETKLHYHYISFPLDVIASYKTSKVIKLIKKLMYLPEYYLTAFASSFNSVSCLGENGKSKVPSIIRAKALTLYEASYTKEFQSLKTQSNLNSVEKVRFLYVGRLVDGKGLEELIESVYLLNNLQKYSFCFTIVGDGKLKKKLEKLVDEYELKEVVQFKGAIKFGEDLDRIYAAHDVLVSPSFSETGPRTVLEAASNFLYVISTDVGYVREVFCHNECLCTLIKSGSVMDLVKSYEFVLNNKNTCKVLADKSEKRSKSYTLDDFVESIIKESKIEK